MQFARSGMTAAPASDESPAAKRWLTPRVLQDASRRAWSWLGGPRSLCCRGRGEVPRPKRWRTPRAIPDASCGDLRVRTSARATPPGSMGFGSTNRRSGDRRLRSGTPAASGWTTAAQERKQGKDSRRFRAAADPSGARCPICGRLESAGTCISACTGQAQVSCPQPISPADAQRRGEEAGDGQGCPRWPTARSRPPRADGTAGG